MASVGAGKERVRKSFKLESEALAWEKDQEALREASKALPAPSPKCWTMQQALKHVVLHQWKGTGGEYTATLNAQAAVDFFGPDTPTSAVVATEVLRYMSHLIALGNSAATRNRKLSALRVMLTAASDYGNLEALPKMKRAAELRGDPKWFREETIRDMLAMCLKLEYLELHDFITIGLHTGFRSGEMRMLTVDHDHDGAFILPPNSTKSGAPRRIPLTDEIKAIVQQRKDSGQHRIFPTLCSKAVLRGQWEDMRAHLGKMDDPAFTPHKLRHTCATQLVNTPNVNLKEVQAWLGHEVIETTMIYSHLQEGALDATLKKREAHQHHG